MRLVDVVGGPMEVTDIEDEIRWQLSLRDLSFIRVDMKKRDDGRWQVTVFITEKAFNGKLREFHGRFQ